MPASLRWPSHLKEKSGLLLQGGSTHGKGHLGLQAVCPSRLKQLYEEGPGRVSSSWVQLEQCRQPSMLPLSSKHMKEAFYWLLSSPTGNLGCKAEVTTLWRWPRKGALCQLCAPLELDPGSRDTNHTTPSFSPREFSDKTRSHSCALSGQWNKGFLRKPKTSCV